MFTNMVKIPNDIQNIMDRLLGCSDSKYITRIYAKDGSIVNGSFGNWVGLVVEVSPEFTNESLYDLMDDIQDEPHPYSFALTIDVDDMEKGNGVDLWKRD